LCLNRFMDKNGLIISVNLFRRSWFMTAAIFVASLALYTATLAPGLLWGGGDFAAYQTLAALGKPNVEDGVFAHPLWVILAHPFTRLPLRDPAWRANFASAVFGAAALSLVFLCCQQVTRSKPVSLLATGALAVSHTFWTYAVMPKVYSLNALLLTACIYLLLRWREKTQDVYLYLAALLYGISFLNHLVMATAAPGFAAFIGLVLWQRRKSTPVLLPALLACLSFGLGLTPLVYLSIRAGTAAGVGGAYVGFLKGLGYALTHLSAWLKGIGWGILLGMYQFPLTAFAGLLGLYVLCRRDRAEGLLVLLAILSTWAFLLGALDPRAGGVYVWNLHYYLQAYVPFTLALAAGLQVLWVRFFQGNLRQIAAIALTLLLPVLVYAAAPRIARAFISNLPDFRPLPGRDNLAYVLSPWKHHETGAREFGKEVLGTLPPNSVLFADYSLWSIFNYLQVIEGARPDVILVKLDQDQPAMIQEYRSNPNLFLADTYRYYDLEGIQRHFDIIPDGLIYRLVPK
jgi:hypothetical protein